MKKVFVWCDLCYSADKKKKAELRVSSKRTPSSAVLTGIVLLLALLSLTEA